ncbi:MAG: ORF6N domain-containing protein [Nitrospirae bacterium]|nr:ORF6N domain-containing protein [Nitrospirota bacterium]
MAIELFEASAKGRSPPKALNQAVKRNIDRFPEDFMFQLTNQEKEEVVTSCDHLKRLKFSPNLPYVFTEHGAIKKKYGKCP